MCANIITERLHLAIRYPFLKGGLPPEEDGEKFRGRECACVVSSCFWNGRLGEKWYRGGQQAGSPLQGPGAGRMVAVLISST